ncbi:MAG TPA: hypothetical protein VJ718_06885, partial [Candidatus Binataceae bacterium]|nr:hypothetical protein [Candidatus Binataceae bacterium]
MAQIVQPELAEYQREAEAPAKVGAGAGRLHDERLKFAAVFATFWAIYAASGCWRRTVYDAHVYLSYSFLLGRFDLINPPDHFEMVRLGGHAYIAYGIGPSLIMLPFVAIWGLSFHQALFSAGVAALAMALWWSTLGLIPAARPKRMSLTAVIGLGSLFWFYAGESGDTWALMHVSAACGLMLALREVFGKGRGWLAGLGFGIAVLSRQPALIALPFFAGMLWRRDSDNLARNLRREFSFACLLGLLIAFDALYNHARFGSFLDNGYKRVVIETTDARFLPWGLFSFRYVPGNIATYFFRLPENLPAFPWYNPTMAGFSVFISTPALLLALAADFRKPANYLALLACASIQFLYLTYYWSGYAQFGCRYSI